MWAQIEISDPRGQLQQLGLFLKPYSFEESFACGVKTSFFSQVGVCKIDCNENFCAEKCPSVSPKLIEISIEDCMEDSVYLYSSIGQEWKVTKTDFLESHSSILLTFLKNFSAYKEPVAKISIDTVIYPRFAKIIENGKLKPITVLSLELHIYSSLSSEGSSSVFLTLDPNEKGLNQLMSLSNSISSNSEYIVKRKGFIL
jgi:hypothetical protein